MRLHFFPALLPLAPLIPWLLTALGAVAGLVRAVRRRREATWVAALLFVAALGTAAWLRARMPSAEEGTRLTPAASLPQPRRAGAGDVSIPAKPQLSGRVGLLTEVWSRFSTRRVISASIADSGSVLVGTQEGELQKVSAKSGDTEWTLRKAGPILSSAALLGRMAFVGEGLHTAQSSSLTAIDLDAGKTLWQREFLGHLESAPAVDGKGGRVFVTAGPGGVWALGAADGEVKWHARVGHADCTPLLLDGTLWVTAQPSERAQESRLFALDAESGKTLSEHAIPGLPWGAPRAAGDLILFTSGIGQIGEPAASDRGWSHAYSISRKSLVWSVALSSMPMLASALSEPLGLVFHALKTGEIVALRIADGKPAWKYESGSTSTSPPLWIADHELVVATGSRGQMVLLDAKSGKELQRVEVGSQAVAPPLYRDGRLLVATGDSLTSFEVAPRP